MIEIVWGGNPPPTVESSVQTHLSYLRRVLGAKSTIVARQPGYLLDLPTHAVDVTVARQLIQREQPSDHAGRAAQLRAALSMWRGTSLEDVRDVPWLRGQSESLERLRLDAVHALFEVRLSLGEHAQSVPDLESVIEQHPYREDIHRLLILALYRAGRQVDALAAYQRLRRTLADEFGIDPSRESRHLEAAVLRQDPALDAPPATIALNSPVATPHPAQLPQALPAFIGRESELAQLDGMLDATTISVLSGTAGVGKTALAVHWAHRVADRFPDGQLYVDLRGANPSGSAMEPDEAIRDFLDAFGVTSGRVPAALDAQAGLYRSVLAGKRVLIVLDNARDGEQIRPLLPGTPESLVLVTSRSRLPGLIVAQGARCLNVGLLSLAESREILTKRLGDRRVAAEPDAVDAIIARCARLPLALAIAAAKAATQPNLPLSAVAADLVGAAAPLDPFQTGDPATDIRHVLSWSYDFLCPPAAKLFRQIGLCMGPDIGLTAMASLAGLPMSEVKHLVGELLRAQLLTEPTSGRYAFHDLLRAYAAEQARTHDSQRERLDARQRVIEHYLHSAHAANTLLASPRNLIDLPPLLTGVTAERIPDSESALTWFATEHRVLLATIATESGGCDEYVWRLAWTLTTFLARRGYWSDYKMAQEAALNAASRLGSALGLAYAHRGLGIVNTTLGQLDHGHFHQSRALELFEKAGEHAGAAQSEFSLASIAEKRGLYGDALAHSIAVLRRFQQTGYRLGQAYALNGIGWCHAHLGDHERALTCCRQALQIFEELGDRAGIATTLDSLGYIYIQLAESKQAVDCYDRAIQVCRDMGDLYNAARIVTTLCGVHARAGNPTAAHTAWEEASALLDQLDGPAADQLRANLGPASHLSLSASP